MNMAHGVYEEGKKDGVRELGKELHNEIEQLDWYFNQDSGIAADIQTSNAWYKIREEITKYEKD